MGLYEQLVGFVSDWRTATSTHIRELVPGQAGAMAAALLTGDRSGLSSETLSNMRESGLAHLLAISGLHMGLVVGIVFFATRAVLALFPAIALRFDIRRAAAVCAILSGFLYLLLSGGSVPTQRAYLMTFVVLSGILIDRRVMSMRTVGIAATPILVFRPEMLLEPGFQMSFAAVVALVSVFRQGGLFSRWQAGGPVGKGARYIVALALSSLTASLATMVIAASFFNQVSPGGVLANLVAIPLTAFLIMPMGVLSGLAAVIGLESFTLAVMSEGISGLLGIADLVSRAPWASLKTEIVPVPAMLCIVAGGLWLCLWTARWRFFGLIPMIFGTALYLVSSPPDVLVADQDGHRLVMVRGDAIDDRGILVGTRMSNFFKSRWGDKTGRDDPEILLSDGRKTGTDACDQSGCVTEVRGVRLAVNVLPEQLEDDCANADFVLALDRRTGRCTFGAQSIVLPPLTGNRVLAVRMAVDGFHVRNFNQERGLRPWTRGE